MSKSPYPLLTLATALLVAACQTVPAVRGFTADQQAVLQQQGFVETAEGWELSMADRLLFESDSAALNPAMIGTLDRLASTLGSVGIRNARVDGHTDSTGSDRHNVHLSSSRARIVGDMLTARGFRVQVQGRGETEPIASNQTENGRQLNRRVVIIVTPE